MPIYEYTCELCGHHLEALQKLSDPLLTDCPECGRPGLKKQISAAGFRLKGSGWYETDFKNKSSAKQEEKAKKVEKNQPPAPEGCSQGVCAACAE